MVYHCFLRVTDKANNPSPPQNTELGVYVKLLEYNNADGMIPLGEVSRRRIRSIQKEVRIGKNEAVVVIRVNKEKGPLSSSPLVITDGGR